MPTLHRTNLNAQTLLFSCCLLQEKIDGSWLPLHSCRKFYKMISNVVKLLLKPKAVSLKKYHSERKDNDL